MGLCVAYFLPLIDSGICPTYDEAALSFKCDKAGKKTHIVMRAFVHV